MTIGNILLGSIISQLAIVFVVLIMSAIDYNKLQKVMRDLEKSQNLVYNRVLNQ